MKFLSLLLSFIMTFTALPLQSLMNRRQDTQTNTEAVIENDDVTLEGGGGIGGLLTESIQQSQQNEAAKDEEENVSIENKILDVVMTDNIATVSFNNDKICKIIVAIFDEEGKEMLAHGMLENIEEYAETAYVTIDNGTIPQYYLLRAFLLDENNIALHKSFETNYYTQAHQEFLAKTTDDFEGEEILNLDEDKTNNFAVYNDGVIHITENGENTLLSADDETLTYVFENVNGEVENLKTGDIVNYNSGDTNLIFKVKTVTFDGTRATVMGEEELALDEVFNFVKINTEYTGEEKPEMDTTDIAEGVEFQGFMEDVQTYARVPLSQSVKFSFGIDVPIVPGKEPGEGSADDLNISLSIKGNVGFVLDTSLVVSFYGKEVEIEFSVDLTTYTDISVDTQINFKEIPLGEVTVPLGTTGVSFVCEWSFVVEAEAKISYYNEKKSNIAFEFNKNQGIKNASKKYKNEPGEVNVEGEIFVGVKAFLGLSALGDVVKIGGEATIGISITGTMFVGSTTGEQAHKCSLCTQIALDSVVNVDLSLKIKFLVFKFEKSVTLVKEKQNIAKCYFSHEKGFGWGECPNVFYQVKLHIVGLNGSPVENATVKVVDNDIQGTTNSKGMVELTVPKGNFEFLIDKSEYISKVVKEKISSYVTFTVILLRYDDNLSGELAHVFMFEKCIASGMCGEKVMWSLFDNGTLAILGEGEIKNYSYKDSPWYDKISKIKKVIIDDDITCIGNCAFCNCDSLTSVTIPDSVTNIGRSAFSNCTSLTSVTIPDSVTSIGNSAFELCESLTSVTIPDSVTSIGPGAFHWCSSLTSLTIPDSVTTIGDSAFAHCDSLTSVTIPDSVTSIGDYAFYDCDSLTSVEIDNGVTRIDAYAFSCCDSLTSVTIPDSVTSIGPGAFYGCSSLTDVCYGGSQEQWNKISIGSSNDPLLNATIHFNSAGSTVYASANVKTLAMRKYEVPKMLAESETVIDDPLANIVTKDDLVPGLVYTLIIMKGTEDNYALTNDSLLYITDTVADESGVATFTHYCNFATTSWVAVVYGGCNHHASDWITVAEPTFTEKGLKAQYCTKCSVTLANEEIDIIPEKMVIESLPEKLTYSYGDTLDLTGLTVEYTYTDGRENVSLSESDYTVYGFDAYAFGVQTIIIESGIYKARFDITVDLTVLPESFTDKIEAGTTVESLAELYPDATVYALTADGKKTADGDELLKTGMILQIVQPDGTVNSMTVIVKGDATGDGIVNGKDIIRVKKQIAQGNAVEHIEYADINSDGVVNEDDITALMSF